MAAIPGSIRVTGFIAPSDSTDTYAVHEDIYGKGGLRPVANTTERDAITADRRKLGMWVYCIADGKVYTLSGGLTNGDWVEVSLGEGILTPEFVVSSPRTIADADHGKSLITGAAVGGGLIYTLPLAPTAGLRVTIGTPGYATNVVCTGIGRIVGPGYLAAPGVEELRSTLPGHALTLVYVGSNLWSVDKGQGYWAIYSGGVATGAVQSFTVPAHDASVGEFVVCSTHGQLTTTSMTADTLVARGIFWTYADETARLAAAGFTIADVGKWALQSSDATLWQLSSHGPPATWFEVSPGATPSALKTSFEETSIDLIDATDFTAEEFDLTTTEAVCYRTAITSTTNTGLVTIYFYSDVARSEVIFTLSVDLSDATTYVSDEAYGAVLETTGTIYGTVYCSGVGGGETIDLWISACVIEAGSIPTPLPSPYGQGIEDDGTGKPRIDLASDGGLAFDGSDNLVLDPDTTADVYPTLSAAGVAITGAVTDSTDEVIAAKKMFDALGCTPLADPGPPVADTYETGQEVLDSNLARWRCTSGGTPGDWVLIENTVDDMLDAYDTCLAGETVLIPITTTGNAGIVQTLQIWALVDDVPGDYGVEFRARIYLDTALEGRGVIWQATGYVGQTYLTASLPAAQGYLEVNDVDAFITDDPVVVIETENRYELGRISSRDTGAGTITIAEALEDASSWDADTAVCGVAEFFNVSFRNTDAVPANQNQVILELRNNSIANDVTFFVRAYPISLGVLP